MPEPSRPPTDPRLGETLAGVRRVRWAARLAALAAAGAGASLWGEYGLAGAALGWLVVEINLGLLARLLARAASGGGRSLWPVLIRFYLTFGATITACVLVIRNHWGHPLAFLLGLFTFFAGLTLALVSFIFKKPEAVYPGEAAKKPETSNPGTGA
jgi:peptidoglycan biosynthesis protein MviN/MurJ (putative lipid II flippase)